MVRWVFSGLVAMVSLAGLAAGSQAVASDCCGGDWYWGRSLYNYERDNIPYFALYPPVYYSLPVARTYGYSPFAYPPGTMTPELVASPQIIDNPHVEEKPAPKKPKPASNKSASAPRIIVNPYVSPIKLSQTAR